MRITKSYSRACVYAISSPTEGVVYIGATRTTIAQRLSAHRGAARAGRSSPITRWIRENSADAVAIPLADDVPLDQVDEAEHRFIEAYRAAGAKLLNVQVTFYDKSP